MRRKPDSKNIFGERLRDMRKERGYSMDMLCDQFNKAQSKIKLNKSTVSRYENGTQEPMLSTVAALAKFFDVAPMYLMGNSNIKNGNISDIHNSSVVQANNANTLIIESSNTRGHELSEQAAELLRIFESLDIREQTELLSFAFHLEERSNKKA